MNVRHRRRRSCLAVPGSNPRMLAKASNLSCDHVFMDLEDAVAPSQKESARQTVIEALREHPYEGQTCAVRINDVTSPYVARDIIEIVTGAGDRLDCLMIPKVDGADHVHFVDHLVNALEKEVDRAVPLGLEILIESPQGAMNLAEIATASKRIETLIFGCGDYALSMGLARRFDFGTSDTRFPGVATQWVMSELATCARANGIQAIDGPYASFNDESGYREVASRARTIGFAGKWCIHPNQIDTANAVFAPSQDEVETARRVLDAYNESLDRGVGAVAIDGLLVDEASRKLALDILAEAGVGERESGSGS